jgi:hypothetical protein
MGGFFPISPLVVITNTSYAAQAGVMDDKWAARVVRGKKIIVEKTMSQLGLDDFVGVIYGHIRVEGLSRHSVAMCAGRLMQYARSYEQAGICPNYEEKGLVREGEEAIGALHESDTSQHSETLKPQQDAVQVDYAFSLPRLDRIPTIKSLGPVEAWRSDLEAHSILVAEVAAYSSSLGGDHPKEIFGQTARALIRSWTVSGKSDDLVTRFVSFIQACSRESQLALTGTDKITIETGGCEMLRIANDLKKKGMNLPPGYPCAFHEILGAKVAETSGANVSVNTSSSGCTVTVSLKLSSQS